MLSPPCNMQAHRCAPCWSHADHRHATCKPTCTLHAGHMQTHTRTCYTLHAGHMQTHTRTCYTLHAGHMQTHTRTCYTLHAGHMQTHTRTCYTVHAGHMQTHTRTCYTLHAGHMQTHAHTRTCYMLVTCRPTHVHTYMLHAVPHVVQHASYMQARQGEHTTSVTSPTTHHYLSMYVPPSRHASRQHTSWSARTSTSPSIQTRLQTTRPSALMVCRTHYTSTSPFIQTRLQTKHTHHPLIACHGRLHKSINHSI